MQGQGFLATPRHSPTSFGLAFAITGAGVAALLLASPYVRERIKDGGLIVIDVPLPPPLAPRPDPKPKPDPRTVTDKPTSKPPVSPPPNGSTDITGQAETGLVTGVGAGDLFKPAPVPIPDVPPVPNPVIVDARYDPRFTASQQPPYPAAQQREEIEGSVTVRVRIGTDGRVLAVESVRASNEAFFASTRDWALRKWRFKPATRDGVPIESWRTMSVRFTIAR